jgi:hypothetical protein
MDVHLRKEILAFLTPLPAMQTESGRRALLLSAGLDAVLLQVNLNGSATNAVSAIVYTLEQYGTIEGEPALALFLREVAQQVSPDKQRQIEDFCERLRPPAAAQPTAQSARSRSAAPDAAQPRSSWDVFISYAREDRDVARRLYEDLHRAGVSAWLDEVHLRPGQNWKLAIREAMRRSAYFLALLSSRSVSKAGYVQKELREALDQLDLLPPDQVFIIPVRLDACDPLHERLHDLHWADLSESYEEGLRQIVRSVRHA